MDRAAILVERGDVEPDDVDALTEHWWRLRGLRRRRRRAALLPGVEPDERSRDECGDRGGQTQHSHGLNLL